MTDIWEYKKKVVAELEDFIKTADLISHELTEAFEEHNKHNPDFFISTWRDYIYNFNSAEAINEAKESLFKIINNTAKIKRLKEAEEKKPEKDKEDQKSSADLWNEYYKENADYWEKTAKWWRDYNSKKDKKDDKKREEENKKFLDDYDKKPQDSFDEQCKREYVEETERKLKQKNISDSQLSQKLGVSDWKAEMNKSSGWRTAQTFSFDINDAIEKIKNEIVCDQCKETKSPLLGVDAYAIPSKKKKFCSMDCKLAWEKENEDDKKDDSSNNKSPKGNTPKKFGVSDISEFFAWMKKMGVTELSFDSNTNQVVIKCGNNKQLNLNDSGLSTKQQEELTQQLKSTKQPITFEQVNSELNQGKNNDGKGGNGGIIAAIVVVGIILAVIIGVVVYKSRKKDY